VASLSQGRTAVVQCGLFTYKSVPVIFEPPFTTNEYILTICFRQKTPIQINTIYIKKILYILHNAG